MVSISRVRDVGVTTRFEKETCRMVQGEMVLLMGVQIQIVLTSYWEPLPMMGVIILFFLNLEMKKGRPLLFLQKI